MIYLIKRNIVDFDKMVKRNDEHIKWLKDNEEFVAKCAKLGPGSHIVDGMSVCIGENACIYYALPKDYKTSFLELTEEQNNDWIPDKIIATFVAPYKTIEERTIELKHINARNKLKRFDYTKEIQDQIDEYDLNNKLDY